MPVDIFPDIAIPIIAVNFNYAGMSPDDMSGRITAQLERYATTIVNDIEHVESQSYAGMTVIKLFFQPGVNIDLAMSQVTAYGQTALRQMPPGAQPPLIMKYNASSVPDPAAGHVQRQAHRGAAVRLRQPGDPLADRDHRRRVRFPTPSVARPARCRSICGPMPCGRRV